ncbi:MAG: hypothetical protein JWQ27_1432 [Ferruginibacter sp.]|nr:hypothetical protein [Ferruginibacter sp.]
MKYISRLFVIASLAAVFTGCMKEEDSIPLQDTRPDVPVTVANATDFRPGPAVRTSKAAGGAISITLEIPANSGRTIKEITKVVASTSYAAVQNSTAAYNAAPIAGNGRTVTFNTTLAEFFVKNPTITPNPPTSNANLPRAFYFLVTLDNGQQLIPYAVNVLVLD